MLVKHAMPQIEPSRPARTWRLSDAGRAAALAMAGKLSALGLSELVASSEPKAEETARILGGALGLACTVDEGLVEHRRESVPFLEAQAFEAAMQAFFERPGERVLGEESADEALARFDAALAAHRRVGAALLAVCHGTVITLWVARRFGVAPMPFWKSLTLPCAVVIDDAAEPRLITA